MPDRTDFADWQSRLGLSRVRDASLVLGVSRRTIERLRNGAQPHPSTRAHMETLAKYERAISALRELHERTWLYDDDGPPGEGWKSDELRAALKEAKAVLRAAAITPPPSPAGKVASRQ